MKYLKMNRNKIIFAAALIAITALFFWEQNNVYHRPEEAGFLLFQDLAFLPLEVLLVTMILESIIKAREKSEKMEQLNVLVGAFFSEMGVETIKRTTAFITNMDALKNTLDLGPSSTHRDFLNAAGVVASYPFQVESLKGDLKGLGDFLYENKRNLLDMFSNPNLLENSRFTSMLWAVYHLMDEIQNREDIGLSPISDLKHLAGDLERAYRLLVTEWLYYMEHMQGKYPYLFSLAVRKNPFLEKKSVVVY